MNTRDVGAVNTIKSREGNMLYEEDEVAKRWKEYFEELLNEENVREEIEDSAPVEGPVYAIAEEEVKRAISKMKNGKAVVHQK